MRSILAAGTGVANPTGPGDTLIVDLPVSAWSGPAGTGKSHLFVALGHAAIDVGHRVRYRAV